MLPIQPSAVRSNAAPSRGLSHPRPSWRRTLDEFGWFFLFVNLVWAIAVVFFLVLR